MFTIMNMVCKWYHNYISPSETDILMSYLPIYEHIKYDLILAPINAKMSHTECGSVNNFTTFGKLMRSGLESYNNN